MTEPRLTKAAIVDTAISLADTDGLDALSMRRIADRMGVGAMSLYRHIANKDVLIAAMADEVAGRYPYRAVEAEHRPTALLCTGPWRSRPAFAPGLQNRRVREFYPGPADSGVTVCHDVTA